VNGREVATARLRSRRRAAMKVCMLLHKSVVHDARVRREAKALAAAGHDVVVVHLAGADVPQTVAREGYRVVPALGRRTRLPLRAHRLVMFGGFVRAVRRERPDVVHAHDAAMLAPGLAAASSVGARLVYDSHELATGVPYRERLWALFVRVLERAVIRRCDAVLTVSDGIADRLVELHGLRRRPAVVRNLPDVAGPPAGGGRLRRVAGIGDAPLVLHQGAPARHRGCEQLVRAMEFVPDAELVFLGDEGDPGYVAALARLAEHHGLEERVHFVPSVQLEELLAETAEADVGVSLLEDVCENHRLALPNKVFEYVAAGVPVVVSRLPEVRRLVEERGIGWTADASDPADIARALREALAGREEPRLRANLREAARELSWASEQGRLLAVYDDLGASRRRATVLVRNPCSHDARVLREAKLLERLGYDVEVLAVTSTQEQQRRAVVDGVRVRRLSPGSPPWRRSRRAPGLPQQGPAPRRQEGVRRASRPRRLAVTLDWYARATAAVLRRRPELLHCNDYNTAWIGVAAKLLTRSRFVYDAHELWPDRNLRPEPRAWLLACEWLFTRVADRVLTTSPGYAEVMARRYRIPPPLVVRNIPEAPATAAVARRSNGAPLALYFGALTRNRGLEEAIAALPELPELRLRLVGPDAWGFRAELARLAERLGVQERVELWDPVAVADGWGVISEADVGLALIQPSCLSYELTLPNKLFEYTAAGVPVLGSSLPMISDFISRHGVGLTAAPGDVRDVAAKLRAMLEPDANARMREATRRTAATLTWAGEQERLARAYEELSR
jgi:glycosyltransferase involved in cell wall biosynthesis